MTGGHQEIGGAFVGHREQGVRRSCLWSKLRRIREHVDQLEKVYDRPESMAQEAKRALEKIGMDDADVLAILEELADASRKVHDLAGELRGKGMGDYLKD